jgi:ribonuclease HI
VREGELGLLKVTERKQVTLHTDGACIGNPGPGGWACVLRFATHAGEMFGSEANTTNNRMEIKAVIEGLRALRESCAVTVWTDSQYVQLGMTQWLEDWKANGWRKRGSRTSVLNRDLWVELDTETKRHEVAWKWVKGHADNEENLRCDFLANRAAREQVSSSGVIKR